MTLLCLLCRSNVNISKIAKSNFEKHLASYHIQYLTPETLRLYQKAFANSQKGQSTLFGTKTENALSDSNESTIEQQTSASFCTPKMPSAVELAKVSCIGSLPLSFSDSLWFHYLMDLIFSSKVPEIPGRKAVTMAFDSETKKAKDLIVDRLKLACSPYWRH